MPETDLSALPPDRIVELLEGMTPGHPDLDINIIGQVIDPRAISRDQFVRLIAGLDRLAGLGADVDLRRMDANTFARLIGRASTDQVQAALDRPELRTRILNEIFRRMADHLRADRATRTKAVVHWRLTGGIGEGGYDRYETIIEDGACVVHDRSTRDARVTITLHPVDFLRLITNNASGPVLFMTGKLKINGDLGFAAGLTSLFELPRG